MTTEATREMLRRRVPPQPHPYLAQMARFADGPVHSLRRAALMGVMPPVDGLREATRQAAVDRLSDECDAVPIAFDVPVAVLGDALGVGDVSAAVGLLCDTGDVAADLPDVARASLLFQCRDATAALILGALVAATDVERVLAVTRTRRVEPDGTVAWVSLADAPYGSGDHACPGRDHARELALGVLDAVRDHVVVSVGPDLDKPNMQVPASVMLRRR